MTQPRRAGLIGTVVVHVLLFGGALWVARDLIEPVQIVQAIELVAAPMPTTDAPSKHVSKPVPPKTEDVVPTLPPKKTPPKPDPKKPEPAKKDPPVAAKPVEKPIVGQTPKDGTDALNMKIDGVASEYPEFIKKMLTCVGEKWGLNNNQPFETEVSFVIHKDGTVSEPVTVRKSKSYQFDGLARTTILQVGKDKCFGTPPINEMPISFTFRPIPR